MMTLVLASLVLTLRYDPTLTAAGFPSPVVDVTINGQQALLLVDTGASVHTWANWFVAAARLPSRSYERTVSGSTGSDAPVRIVEPTDVATRSGPHLQVAEGVAVDLPPMFEERRIAGLLSPQLLAALDEEAVLDLRVPRLTIRPARSPSRVNTGRTCTNGDSPFRNRLYVARADIAGVAASLLLDTGATRTTSDSASAAAAALAPKATDGGENRGVGGAVDRLRVVPAVRIVRGQSATTLDLRIGRSRTACAPDGLLAMDALRQCVATLSESAVVLACR